MTHSTARAYGVGLAVVGAAAVIRADRVAELVADDAVPDARVIRVLGARTLAQGAVLVARPDRRSSRASAGVDATHALTMFALAAVAPRYRRPALLSAGIALVSALGALITA